MRSILITVLLLIVVVGLVTTLFFGDDGLTDRIRQHEGQVSERIMQLNP